MDGPVKHTPGLFHAWVLDQDNVWVDAFGREHKLSDMPKAYKLNVLLFLYEQHRERFDPRKSPLIEALRGALIDD